MPHGAARNSGPQAGAALPQSAGEAGGAKEEERCFLPVPKRVSGINAVPWERASVPTLLPVELYNDTRVQMAPSPVFPLPFTPLSGQTTILIVLFPQIAAVSTIFLPVIHVVVAAVPIVIPLVPVMVVIGL